MQCGAQLMLVHLLWCLVNCLVQFCKCNVQFFRMQFCILFHVRNKVNLSLQNTWETNTIAIFPSCQACLVWLYIVQCGAQLTFGSFVLWCLVNYLVQFCNAMFNCCGCILLFYTMWEINRIWMYQIHEKHIQLLYFQVVKHAWFG